MSGPASVQGRRSGALPESPFRIRTQLRTPLAARDFGLASPEGTVLGRRLEVDGGLGRHRLDPAAPGVSHEGVRLPGQLPNWSTSRGTPPDLQDSTPAPPRGRKVLGVSGTGAALQAGHPAVGHDRC